MKASELINKLSTANPDTEVYVRYMNGDAYGSAWVDNAWIRGEDHILLENNCVYIDISDDYISDD